LIDFEPVTNIGSDFSPAYWKIDNVTKLPFSSINRFIYSGSFTVANVTRDVIIKRQLTHGSGENDLEHEAAVYKSVKLNASLIELLYFHRQVPNSYLVLEKFGSNLSAFLHNKCAIRLQILEELGIALNAFHDAGYVHCDIKPQNILVDSREGSVHLKLCDLDSAERVGELFQHVGSALKYTEQWVSPEVYSGQGGELRVSPAIDVFSYGLIAAVLFDDAISENKTILPRKSDNEILFHKCLTDQVTLNSQMPCQRGKRYQDLVHRMCDLNPATRATLRDVDLALGLNRATAIHAQNTELSKNNEFLKHEVVEKQAEIITHLADIKQSLAELGAKLSQLLENDVELKNMLDTVLTGSFDCPTLFIYVPVAANK
jgi:serine/threonine protein kinase